MTNGLVFAMNFPGNVDVKGSPPIATFVPSQEGGIDKTALRSEYINIAFTPIQNKQTYKVV